MENPSRVAIVTGSSRGIGREIALRLARDGFAVVVNYAGRAEDAESVVREIEAAGGRAIAERADVGDADAFARLFDRAEAEFGGVDALVNNAGVLLVKPLAETTDEEFERLVRINLQGSFNGMRLAASRLRDGGRIVNLSTTVVAFRNPGYTVYAATKAAVESMTGIFAKEMGARGITVNAVAPGPTATDLFLNGKSDALVESLAKIAPLGRLGTPEDIAGVVAFLVGPDGGWVNGQVLRVNGGFA